MQLIHLPRREHQMTTTTHSAAKNVSAITPTQREVISELVGAPIATDQKLFIMTYSPGVAPSPLEKEQAAKNLLGLLAEAHENIRNSEVTETELSDALDEAIKASKK